MTLHADIAETVSIFMLIVKTDKFRYLYIRVSYWLFGLNILYSGRKYTSMDWVRFKVRHYPVQLYLLFECVADMDGSRDGGGIPPYAIVLICLGACACTIIIVIVVLRW